MPDRAVVKETVDKCKRCDGDGWVEIMDPEFAGAVIGARECPSCGGSGNRSFFDDDEPSGDVAQECPACKSDAIWEANGGWQCEACEHEWGGEPHV